ncbi:MAG: hypothetical protein CMJ18_16485 [Phycisphaeraceae bacterium]|nr:hypothetical protein [Phycisphaeraceae bacterium]
MITTESPRSDCTDATARSVDLLALDVDGTLLRTDKTLGRPVFDAVRRAVEHDVQVVLASARPPRSLKPVAERLGLDTWQINYNGALLSRGGRNACHRPLPPALARRVIRTARRIDPDVVVSLEILDKWYTDHFDDSLPTETSIQFSPDFVGPLEAFLRVPVTKLMLLAPPERLGPVRDVIHGRYAGEIRMMVCDDHLIQIVRPDVDKSVALADVARRYGVDRARVMAVGDAPNDLGMLQWAGIGVAMGNAWPTVREAADVVVPSNDEHGVADAIDSHVLAAPAGA